ncbi:hypothetical protein EDC39_10820 [Geothermobacter ehrlichii]|uniref:GIY-YIG domain-containing protein n=1 Tax=Geothermobacter ehrlichii TaxID=213224 RepID=A0A5D3WGY4_9BACT|nr:hypothetical protein [Geothermobacter ehrlichii]TYO98083.1 hypothetical protein EDC39_10820 [Geothermobacter ehrlichii]
MEYKEIKIDFLYGENFISYVCPYEKIAAIKSTPGIYSWHIRIKKKHQMHHLLSLFGNISIQAEVKSTLRLKYQGELKKQIGNINTNSLDDVTLFSDSIFSVNYPLYIGISTNLNKRLTTHKRQFEKQLGKLNPDLSTEIPADSDVESEYFGLRLAKIWPKKLSTDCLFVKFTIPRKCIDNCISRSINCHQECIKKVTEDLLYCETFLNTIFNPVFGRR